MKPKRGCYFREAWFSNWQQKTGKVAHIIVREEPGICDNEAVCYCGYVGSEYDGYVTAEPDTRVCAACAKAAAKARS